MHDKVRVGIISANWGVQAHLPAWRAHPDVEVVAICTAHQDTAEAAAKSNEIPKAYWDYREMAADPDIDLIDVGTRPNLRYDMCMTALKAGKHVYNGVPFADSLEHAKDLKEAQLSSRLVGAIDAYSEYLPPIRMAKELIDDGQLGQPPDVPFQYGHVGIPLQLVRRESEWLQRPAQSRDPCRQHPLLPLRRGRRGHRSR
jgi:predicted dehydrogenase